MKACQDIKKFFIFFMILILSFLGVIFFGFIYPVKYKYNNIINRASERYNVQKELICAMIKAESNFNQDAHSHANAQGLMQITPETFEWLRDYYTHEKNLDISGIKNPETNIFYGSLLISILLKKYNYDEEIALGAYNAGITTIERWKNNNNLDYIPYKETRNYIKKVKLFKKIYQIFYFD